TLPVPLQTLGEEWVKESLHRREWHLAHPVEERRRKRVEKRCQNLTSLSRRAVVAANESTGSLAPMLFGEGIPGRHRLEAHEEPQLQRGPTDEVAIGAHHSLGVSSTPKDRPGEHRLHGMRSEREARHHAKIATPSAERPEKVWVRFLARGDKATVG